MDMINQAEELKREKAKTFVPVDFDRLEKAAKARRLKMKDINAWLERNASYCSQRRKYGTLSAWDVTTIIEHGIPYEEFQPGVREYETADIMNGDEKIAEIQTPLIDATNVECGSEKEYVTIEITEELRGYSMFTRMSPREIIEKALREHLDSALCMLDLLPVKEG